MALTLRFSLSMFFFCSLEPSSLLSLAFFPFFPLHPSSPVLKIP
jgi:hypothetical protein